MKAVCRRFLLVLALCAGVCPALMSATGYKLSIAPVGKTVVISWPTAAANYVLQTSLSLSAASWQAVTNSVVVNGTTNSVTYTNNSSARFFRLYLGSTGYYLVITQGTNKVISTVVISWPTAATNYVLQTTATLTPANWSTITSPAPVTVNNTNFLTYTNNSLTRFFRLYLNTNTGSAYPGMALIPAGSYTMGNYLLIGNVPTNDPDITDANPVSATVSAFYMDTNLVSYGLWQTVYNAAVSAGYGFVNTGSGAGNGANQPVQTVDWYDCVKWCNARSVQASLTPVYYTDAGLTHVYTNGQTDAVYVNWAATGYRLPTEAEWEKAARGGLNGQRFPWGDTIMLSQANYYGDTEDYSYDKGPDGENQAFDYNSTATSPVGYFAPNGYGLYDVAGNVCEWCWDWYGTPYAGGTDPRGPASGSDRTLRGGYWSYYAYEARCADRDQDLDVSAPGTAFFGTGFRCVRGH